MKNIRENQLKKCIFLSYEEFSYVIDEIYAGKMRVSCDYEGISVHNDEEDAKDLITRLSTYYDVTVTSIHADDCDFVGIWIVFE